MNSYLISCLKAGRKACGLTQTQAAKKVGIKQTTLSGYENGVSEPEIDKLIELFKLYKLDYRKILETAYQIDTDGTSPLSPESEVLIRKIDQLKDWERQIVTDLVNGFIDSQIEKCEAIPIASYIHRPYHFIASSAGTGNYLDDDSFQMIRIKETPESEQSDYVVRVDGRSMEPKYYDGDLVLVKKQDAVDDGEIGIFCVDGDSYIKQKKPGYLHSINPDYDDVQLNEFSSAYTLGKVIGKAEV